MNPLDQNCVKIAMDAAISAGANRERARIIAITTVADYLQDRADQVAGSAKWTHGETYYRDLTASRNLMDRASELRNEALQLQGEAS